jgi:hypothetical protein
MLGGSERTANISTAENGYVVVVSGGEAQNSPAFVMSAFERAISADSPEAMISHLRQSIADVDMKQRLRKGGIYVFTEIDKALAFAREWLSIKDKEL